MINTTIVSLVVGVVLSASLVGALIFARQIIGRYIASIFTWTRQNIFTRSGFFWTVNFVFMGVSVLHAGVFFGITGTAHGIAGITQYLGFAVSFFLDLVTIILMQAQLEAKYRGEDDRAMQFVWYIAICCMTSTFANFAISSNDFDAKRDLPHAPWLIQVASPYVLSSFPLFVILMSIAAEKIVNVRPLDKLNEDGYEQDEKKRIKLIEIRNTYLGKEAEQRQRQITIQAQIKSMKVLQSGKLPRSFRWPWEKPIDTDLIVSTIAQQMKKYYDEQVEAKKKEIDVEAKQKQADIQTEIELIKQDLTNQHDQHLEALQIQFEHALSSLENQRETDVLYAISQAGNLQDSEPLNVQISSTQTDDQIEDKPEGKAKKTSTQTGYQIQNDPQAKSLLKSYSNLSRWLDAGTRSANLGEIVAVTLHSPKMVTNRINDGTLKRTANKNLFTIESVIKWLLIAPLPRSKKATEEEDKNESNSKITSPQEPVFVGINQQGNGHRRITGKLADLEIMEV